MGNLDPKFALYTGQCERNFPHHEASQRGFSIMLQGPALQHCFDKLRNMDLNLLQFSTEIRKRFYKEKRVRTLLREWDTVVLEVMISKSE